MRGRKTGEMRTTPVNLLTYDGTRYLVAPRGETQWVRNIRAADGAGELALGRKVEPFRGVELSDEQKPAVLRAYLKRWKAEVGCSSTVSAPAPPKPRSPASHPIIRSSASSVPRRV